MPYTYSGGVIVWYDPFAILGALAGTGLVTAGIVGASIQSGTGTGGSTSTSVSMQAKAMADQVTGKMGAVIGDWNPSSFLDEW